MDQITLESQPITLLISPLPFPIQTVLMVIDLINAFGPVPYSPLPELPVTAINSEFCAKTNSIIDFFSEQGCHILFLCDHHSEADFLLLNEPPHARIGTKAAELMAWIHQPPNSHIFHKRTYDGSTNPQLVKYLKDHNITHCFALGTSTGVCVRHSIEGFIAKGIAPWFLVEDLVGDIFPARHRYFLTYFRNHPQIHLVNSTEIRERVHFAK